MNEQSRPRLLQRERVRRVGHGDYNRERLLGRRRRESLAS
jgi:hypothetical protein